MSNGLTAQEVTQYLYKYIGTTLLRVEHGARGWKVFFAPAEDGTEWVELQSIGEAAAFMTGMAVASNAILARLTDEQDKLAKEEPR
jgi:hypothetical protein